MDGTPHSSRMVKEVHIQTRIMQEWEKEFSWFTELLNLRFQLYFDTGAEISHISKIPIPSLEDSDTPYARLIQTFNWGFRERAAICLALAPELQPRMLDIFFTKNKTFDRNFTEFGGEKNSEHSGFIPTAETLLFLLGGSHMQERMQAYELLNENHPLLKNRIVYLSQGPRNYPIASAGWRISPESISNLVLGEEFRPQFGAVFPAQLIETKRPWSDLVLPYKTQQKVHEIRLWIDHRETLMHHWGLAEKLRPGFRALFYGPPGTGKTLTASLLGKATGLDVYRIDLSMIVSKYIGETEKNLSQVFNMATNRNWILFFDEADALFGKRTETKDAHDRYANQEVAFLLQRVESYDGLVILASNFRSNIDDAFLRRFESVIHFPLPDPSQRYQLWKQGIPPQAQLDAHISLEEIADKFELSGGAIMNAIRYGSLQAIASHEGCLQREDLLEGIRREFAKEGKSV